MSNYIKDFVCTGKRFLSSGCCLISLIPADGSSLPVISPGQFVQIKVDTRGAFLRRPISVCDVRYGKEIVLYVKPIHEGSRKITEINPGETLNIVFPLGKGFSVGPDCKDKNILLAGGGVGAAPLVYLCRELSKAGAHVTVALGGRSANDIKDVSPLYEDAEHVTVSTDDGTFGEPGTIMENPVFNTPFDRIYCCGPTPMMKAVAKYARQRNIPCEVSLENSMACGIGACLCCVQETSDEGHVCVCTEGPVFNIKRLEKWI